MSHRTRIALAPAAIALLLLTACAPGGDASTGGDTSVDESTTEESTTDEGGFDGVVLSGSGSYAIGTDMPYGGYELSGSPDGQPDGCTWSIQDADGTVSFADQGAFVFITDVPESVTFVTNGCPDWEQFE